jgi:DNA polymerase-3 subunit epsilon
MTAHHKRHIVFDTETTGRSPDTGDRVIEIGCVEVIDLLPTGRTYHVYIHPERDIEAGAIAVHGITLEKLAGKPIFSQIVTDFLDFIGDDSMLVAHNASFDMGFINMELKLCGFPSIDKRRVIDTLDMARRKFPGSPASLDALCKRFGIDNSSRTYHGALLDAQLLAEVYLELHGGRQHDLDLSAPKSHTKAQGNALSGDADEKPYRAPRPVVQIASEHAAWIEMLKKMKKPLWQKDDLSS